MQQYKREWNPHKDSWDTWYWDADKEQFTIKSTHDVTSILEANKRQQSLTLNARYGNERLHHVADIPLAVILRFKEKHGVDAMSSDPTEKRKLRRLLEDPEYKYLKSTTKKLWTPIPVKKRLDGCSL